MQRLKFLLTIILVLTFTPAFAKVIGQWGTTYSIAEPDAYEELMAKVKSVNWQKYINKIKQDVLSGKIAEVNLNVPLAKESRTRYKLYEYTLEFDITDDKGNIIYPKGYKFYPLQYIQYPYTIVVFNGSHIDEVNWFKKSGFNTNEWVIPIITKGNAYKLRQILGRPVYVASKKLLSVLDVHVTPSIVKQYGIYFEIKEVGIDEIRSNHAAKK